MKQKKDENQEPLENKPMMAKEQETTARCTNAYKLEAKI